MPAWSTAAVPRSRQFAYWREMICEAFLDLTPESRLLHQLFAGHPHSYTGTVRRRRVEQAHRDLADPARAALRVIDIAADNGFADVSHFHRVFRQTYGYTPAQLRRGAFPIGVNPRQARPGHDAIRHRNGGEENR
jgi:AraC-like DNA-binding protein